MTIPHPLVISGAVEGPLDEAVLRRLVTLVGAQLGPVYGKKGKSYLHQKLSGYNRAARFSPWIILVDLDQDADCAPAFRDSWLPEPSSSMYFRVSVRVIETWLLADQKGLATFLSVPMSRIPEEPEAEIHPKRAMVTMAQYSRRREIRDDMVPRPSSGRSVGPGYTSRLIEFVTAGWRPDIAARSADSLNGCLRCLRQLVQGSR